MVTRMENQITATVNCGSPHSKNDSPGNLNDLVKGHKGAALSHTLVAYLNGL